MFTGLIEEVGTVVSVDEDKGPRRIVVAAPNVARELKTGDSVSVSGVCLTALDITPDKFEADLAAETVKRTSLASLAAGSLVNLELPAKSGSRLGGHIVQGHVDGVARLQQLRRQPSGDWLFTLDLPDELDKYVVPKGSISVEGISLTVADIKNKTVTIAIIPHTYEATNLRSLTPGSGLNIEVDVLAKYAEKRQAESNITVERLMAEGF